MKKRKPVRRVVLGKKRLVRGARSILATWILREHRFRKRYITSEEGAVYEGNPACEACGQGWQCDALRLARLVLEVS